MYVSTAVVGAVRIQRRNSANNSTVSEFYLDMLAHGQTLVPFSVPLDAGERIRIITSGMILGDIQAGFLS